MSVVNLEDHIVNKFDPDFIHQHGPHEDHAEIINWLKSEHGLKHHLAVRCADNYIRQMIHGVFSKIEIVFNDDPNIN